MYVIIHMNKYSHMEGYAMKTYNYKVQGLECASCAAKIEELSHKVEHVEHLSIDLMKYNVKVDITDHADESLIFNTLNKIADQVEPGAKIIKKEDLVEEDSNNRFTLYRIITATVLLIIGLIVKNNMMNVVFLVFAYVIVGYDVIITAVKNLMRGSALDEHFLMAIATFGAFAINERFEAVLVMLLYQIGEYLQNLAVDQSRKSISSLMDIKPDYANKLIDGEEIRVDPEQIDVDDIIIIRPGEKVPLDGIVVSGMSSIDAKALTGESMPIDVSEQSEVLSGSINLDGVLEVKVSKAYFESTVKQILDLVENASANKAPAEKFIARFAKYYTPVVVAFAFILAFVVPLVTMNKLYDYNHLYNALTFLVISCPCALVISVPLSFFGGIGGASKQGVLFKGSNYVEALAKVDDVFFDKTGTLTEGNFAVVDVISEYDKEEILKYAAYAEYYSNHPIAKSIVKAYGKDIDQNMLKGAEEIPHHGVGVVINDEEVWAGNYKLMQLKEIKAKEYETDKSVVYVSKGSQYLGVIVIADEIKKDAYETINNLRALGVNNIEMLTGDNDRIAQDVTKELSLTKAHANLTPVDKVNIVESRLNDDKNVIFVGDGINDAPVLTMASVGVAMGGLGSDAAIEAADVVIMDDNPNKLSKAIFQSRRTMRIVKQNIVFALSIKFLFMILGTFGISNMAMAVFADVGVSLLAILNAVRLLKVK